MLCRKQYHVVLDYVDGLVQNCSISIVLAVEILQSLDVAISRKHMTLFLMQDKKQNPINDDCFIEENVKGIIYIMSYKVWPTDKLPNMVYQYMNSSLPHNPILCDKLASGLNRQNWNIYITSQLRYIWMKLSIFIWIFLVICFIIFEYVDIYISDGIYERLFLFNLINRLYSFLHTV